MEIERLCEQAESYIIEQRRYFHRHPELSGKEKNTSEAIKHQLSMLGISYTDLKPGYGVAGVIRGALPGKRIGVRADIDALPVQEKTEWEYISENDGISHACGHDAHIAMLLGVAKVLNEQKSILCGTVVLLFQAEEETGGGTNEIIDYLSSQGGLDQLIGLHIWGTVPEGEIILRPGAIFAGGRALSIRVNGKGGHGARPDLTNDPIKAASDLLLQITSIPANYHNLFDCCVISVCTFHAGSRGNIVPDFAEMEGSIRYFKENDAAVLDELIQKRIKGIEFIHDVQIEYKMSDKGVKPVMNDAEAIKKARALVEKVKGLWTSDDAEPICAGDNMGKLLNEYQGFYAVLGARIEQNGIVWPQHSSKFALDEKALRKGCEFMVQYIFEYLNGCVKA